MSALPSIGDRVTYTGVSGLPYPSRLTEGKAYPVTYVDRNDGPEWPAGTCGTPFVAILADDGRPFEAFSYRFKPVEETEQ